MSRPTDLVPLLNVSDVAASIEFYEELGFEVDQKVEEGALSSGQICAMKAAVH